MRSEKDRIANKKPASSRVQNITGRHRGLTGYSAVTGELLVSTEKEGRAFVMHIPHARPPTCTRKRSKVEYGMSALVATCNRLHRQSTHLFNDNIDGVVIFHIEVLGRVVCGYPLTVVEELDLFMQARMRHVLRYKVCNQQHIDVLRFYPGLKSRGREEISQVAGESGLPQQCTHRFYQHMQP